MNRLIWLLRHRGSSVALWLGIGLAAAALALHGLAVQPLQLRLAELQDQREAPREGTLARLGDELARDDEPQAQLAGFYSFFAKEGPLTERLASVHATARRLGLEMKRGDYRLNSQPDRKLNRYQMVLPIQGPYTSIRGFVTTVLREQPTLALEQIVFQRKAIGDGAVDAQVTFAFYLAK
jgi:hypothetical protein